VAHDQRPDRAVAHRPVPGRDRLSLALERFSSALFARGASPGGVYKTAGKLSDASFNRLKLQLDQQHSGRSNHGKSMLLEEGLDWVKQTMTAVESQTVEARRLQIEQVATAFDVPLHRLGIMPEGGGEAVLQSHQMYLNNTLSSDAERWENKLNDTFGLDGEEMGVEFDLDYFNRADIQTRLTALGTAITRSVYTVNEARRKEGLPDDPNGDIIFQPANMVPLGTPPASPAPRNRPAPAAISQARRPTAATATRRLCRIQATTRRQRWVSPSSLVRLSSSAERRRTQRLRWPIARSARRSRPRSRSRKAPIAR
jgi:hypothetical protein